MNRSYRIIPCYTGDVSGVASALYELGGMVVIHDPSGCNSTYNTHDETRWYDHDSLIFISGLSQTDAILGNDEKFIEDIEEAARELEPAFIALASSPIPYMNGTDFDAIARILEADLGIPAFFVPTNGMHDYVYGAGNALVKFAEHMLGWEIGSADPIREKDGDAKGEAGETVKISTDSIREKVEDAKGEETGETVKISADSIREKDRDVKDEDAGALGQMPADSKEEKILVNVLGMTPLDFAAESTMASLKYSLMRGGFELNTCWAMDSTREEILEKTRKAQVNLVISSLGLPLAQKLQEIYGTPYVVGMPVSRFAERVWEDMRQAVEATGRGEVKNSISYKKEDVAGNGEVEKNISNKKEEVTGSREVEKNISNKKEDASGSGEVEKNISNNEETVEEKAENRKYLLWIGEPVTMASLNAAAMLRYPRIAGHVATSLEVKDQLLNAGDYHFDGEEELEHYMSELRRQGKLDVVIADPLYRPICPEGVEFKELPHEAFSGRCFRRQMKDLIGLRFLKQEIPVGGGFHMHKWSLRKNS